MKKNKFFNKKVLLPFYYDKYNYLVTKEKEVFEKNFDFYEAKQKEEKLAELDELFVKKKEYSD